ncbi:hypothetical protein QZH41_000418 [Actinostola sp. cb2023]|nr:hypothetical protein QZH41_000418 [Actinostola sp. cb2023]
MEKETLQSFMDDEWDKIEHYEVKLAEIELMKRKTVNKVELDVQRQRELLDWEKDQELRDIEEQQENILELQEQLKSLFERAEKEFSKVQPTLEKTLSKEREELEHIEKKIRRLEGHKTIFEVEIADEEKDLIQNENQASKNVDIKRKRTSTDNSLKNSELSASMDSYDVERGLENRRMSELHDEVQRLELLKNEKAKIVTESQLALLEKMNSLELYRMKIQENEEKLCELENGFKEREEKHLEKIGLCLDYMREENDTQISGFDVEREKQLDMLWKDYEQIEKTVLNSCKDLEIPDSEEKQKWEDAMSSKRKLVLELVKTKFDNISSLEDELFLNCLGKRLKLDQDEERVLDQERKISEEIRGSLKDKDLAMHKLMTQKDKFHIERERERKLIKSRLKRISRLKTYDDLQSEETIEYLSEEAKKLKETFEKVEEAESSFMGRGIIEASPMTVWEAVRNPLSRYIYDNMLKKINIVEHVEDGLKVVYMLHETSQCFVTHSRDFCYVTKERIELSNFRNLPCKHKSKWYEKRIRMMMMMIVMMLMMVVMVVMMIVDCDDDGDCDDDDDDGDCDDADDGSDGGDDDCGL